MATEAVLTQQPEEDDDRGPRRIFDEQPTWVLTVADKLLMLFQHDNAGVHDVRIRPVWAAGELLEFGGNFNNYVVTKQLQKQEGIIFRHLLRLILPLGELKQLTPIDSSADEWQAELDDIAERLTDSCHAVDATSTDRALAQATTPTEPLK